MLTNTAINRMATVKIAKALGELNRKRIRNALPGHLYFDGVDVRMEIIIGKMNAIAHGLQ